MPLAAAVIGSAVVGAGASIYGASQSKKAANKALDAQNTAAQQQLAAQQAALDRVTQLNEPFRAGGLSAFDALLAQYGLQPRGTAGTSPLESAGATPSGGATQPAVSPQPAQGRQPWDPGYVAPTSQPTRTGGQFDAQAYLQANPDVLQNAQQRVADGTAQSVEQVAQEHYNLYGKPENRAQPMTPVTETPATTDAAGRPLAAPLQDYTRPTGPNAPDLSSYFSNFEADPGYDFRRKQALDGVNAASAARGKLRSGDAAAALATRASDLASQEYNNWFSRQLQRANLDQGAYQFGANRSDANFNNDRAYGTSLWQYGTDRGDRNFLNDRSYAAGRYDTQTGNLFDLAGIGIRAAGNVGGAAQGFADSASNIYGSQANAAANAAQQRATANSQLAGGLAGTASNLFANWGGASGGGTGPGVSTVGQAWNNYFGGGFQSPYTGTVRAMPQPVF